jgi:MoaA/NifB/PqqE/SkfB family radical SAM enzyme
MYYSKLKILHHRKKLDALAAGKITGPVHVRIKPTNICNHKCSYCSYQNSYGQLGQDMNSRDVLPREKFFEVIADCAYMNVKAITFSGGGEPLLHPDIGEAMLQAQDFGIQLGLLTNGVLLEGALAKVAIDCCTWIRISMDGWDSNSYHEYRKCSRSDFDKLMENIKNAAGHNCTIGVNIIIDRNNADHLVELVKKVYDLGVRSIKLSPCIVSNNAQVNEIQHAGVGATVLDQVRQIEAMGIKVYNSYHLELEGFKKEYTWCPYIQILPIIGADQNVYVCHDKAYNNAGILGSIKDNSFKKFWMHGKDKFYKINPSLHCNHHCVTDCTNKMLLEYLSIEHKEFA